ncbi:MAG: NADH:flavin oxidoreductase [Desulfobacteraceae bacterium]
MNLLLSPYSTKNLQLENRVVFLPFQTAYADENGFVTKQLISHYSRMAKSGAGLIIVEASAISPDGASGKCPVISSKTLPGLKKLASAVKNEGKKVFIQIFHAGRFANNEPVGPSSVEVFGRPVKEITLEQMEDIKQNFVNAALIAKEAGFDGVEIHGATGYLLSSFISKRTNLRTDEYGQNLENRMKFPLEVSKAVRDAAGSVFPVGYRFMPKEYLPSGLEIEEASMYAEKLVQVLNPEYLSVASGTHECYAMPEMSKNKPPEMFMVKEAEQIKKAVPDITIIAAGHLQTPKNCEMLIQQKKADLIGLARVLFADPDWVKKASEKITDDIRPCIQCGNCVKQIKQMKPAFCAKWTKDERNLYLKDI